ncbi:outer membrane beta-barrel protein [Flavobacteriaceae bacterium]|nr:outer membrane beta-barrel protein [Flavobacteriaceae bacterium]
MKHLLSCMLIVLALNFTYSQEAYFSMGRNFTTYDYTNSEGNSNDNIEGSSGAAYELGYVFSLGDKLGLAAGLTLNEFNATGGNQVNNYSWETNYLGVQGIAKYAILDNLSGFGLNVNAGVNFNHIVNGKQKINGQTFDLTDNDEFKGLFVQPIIGLDAKYQINDTFALGLGYQVLSHLM